MDVKLTSKSNIPSHLKEEIIEHTTELEHYFNRIEEISVIVGEDRDNHKQIFTTEIIVNCEHKNNIVVNGESEDNVLTAFHRAWHKAKRQLRKHKEKLQKH